MRLKSSLYLGAICLATILGGLRTHAAAVEQSAAQQVASARIFTQPLSWVGAGQPNSAESADLLVSISVFKTQGIDLGIASLEGFLRASPNSGWAPSLRAFLGKYYRERGRYTLALDHWEKAWDATKAASDANGKHVADFTLGHWTKLLASLGRREQLAEIFEATKGRRFDDPQLLLEYQSAHDGFQHMNLDPGTSYRCGTYALNQVAHLLKGTNYNGKVIGAALSPHEGFTMGKLVELAGQASLPVVPVFRKGDADFVVPSVIHWKQDHYAAIVARRGDLYKVVDPTFERTIWMTKETISAEASGHCLIPQDQFTAKADEWGQLSAIETQAVRGRGFASVLPNGLDCNGNPVSGGGDGGGGDGGGLDKPPEGPKNPNCTSCGGGDGGGGGGSCEKCTSPGGATETGGPSDPIVEPDAKAMPVWSVSEPYINLWIKDVPVFYNTALNGQMFFKMQYKQRQTQPYDTNIYNFGKIWHGNVRTYLKVVDSLEDPNYTYYDATLYGTDGTERRFLWDDTSVDLYSRSRLERMVDGSTNLIGFKVLYKDGSVAQFTHLRTNLVGELEAFLTVNADRTGKGTVTFNYQTTNDVIQLTSVVDASGGTNTFRYDTNNLWLIKEIENPYGGKANFTYNASGYLTNITDMAGMASSFLYDANGWVTNLTTPYGTTTFSYSADINLPPVSYIWHAIEVTVPNGAKHLYMYRSTIIQTPDLTQELFRYGTFEEYYHYNAFNSAYWSPRQYALLSTNDISQLSTNDFAIARNRLWQGDLITTESESYFGISPLMLVERWPQPTASEEGHKIFYTYDSGQSSPRKQSYLLPDMTTNVVEYFRNSLGNPTNAVSTWSTGSSSTVLSRTNQYIYDANGIDLVKVIGPSGHTEMEYAYNTNHQVLFMTNAVGYVTSYTYNTNGQTASIVTPAGLTTTNIYYSDGRLQLSVDIEIARTNRFFWTNGLLYAHVNECGLATTNTFDALNRLTSIRYPDGTTKSNIYTYLDLTATKDRLGNWAYMGFDNMRRLTVVTNALGNTTRYGYCICGSLESVTNALGQATSFTYDWTGRKTSVIDAESNPTTYAYDKLGRIFYVTDALNRSATNYYNHQGSIIAMSNALGRVKAIAYDIEDMVTNTVDANGVGISMAYDDAHRLLSRTYPDAGVERYGYSAKGMVSYTNQLSKFARYGYDVAGRKTSETNANNEVIAYSYNASGNLLTLTDGKNQTTTWNCDDYCRVTNKVDALTNVLFVYRYDGNGRLTNRWSAAKGNTYYAYDAIGSLTNIDYSVSADIQMQYDALQHLTNMVDAVGTTKFTYTSNGQLLSEDGPWDDDVVTYSYAANYQKESMQLLGPDGRIWQQTYDYDMGGRLHATTSNAGRFDYAYGAGASRLVAELQLPGESKIVNTYDGNARLTISKLQNSSAIIINQHSYVYNAGNQRIKQTFVESNYLDYAYDDIGQLKTAIGKEAGGSVVRLHEQFGYAYDAARNLNYRTNNALIQDFNVNVLNELTTVGRTGTLTVAGKVANGMLPFSVTVNGLGAVGYVDQTFAKSGFSLIDGTNSFTAIATDSNSQSATNIIEAYLPAVASCVYDLNGNLISDGKRSFVYDDENQLISVMVTNEWKSEFVYDGKMRKRVRKEYTWFGSAWSATNEVRYIHNGNLILQERSVDGRPQVTYTRGCDFSGTEDRAGGIGGLLARSRHSSTNGVATTHACYHADGNGNIVAMINREGQLVASYRYDPYGNMMGMNGVIAGENLFRFSSMEEHVNSGLVGYLFRYYTPKFQRWITRDPILERGGLNLYGFVNGAPINRVDYFGTIDIPGGLVPPSLPSYPPQLQAIIKAIAAGCAKNGKPPAGYCIDFCDATTAGNSILTAQCMADCEDCWKKPPQQPPPPKPPVQPPPPKPPGPPVNPPFEWPPKPPEPPKLPPPDKCKPLLIP